MKIFALLFTIFALVSSAAALKNAICGLEHSKNGGNLPCRGYFPSWSYNADTKECVEFIYGGCLGNENNFITLEMCEDKCKE